MNQAGKAGAAVAAAAVALVMFLIVIVGGGSENPAAASPLFAALNSDAVPAPYRELIQRAGTVCPEVSAPLIAAQIEAESGWNPRAVSGVGAQGLTQFMPGTWATYGIDGGGDGKADPWDPADAIASQAHYDCALAEQMKAALTADKVRGDLTELILAAYNAGPGAVLAARGVPSFAETRGYVTKIMSGAAKYSLVPTGGAFGARVVAAAMTQLGVPYSYGGGSAAGPSQGNTGVGLDCSGLVLFAVAQASGGELQLPHNAEMQRHLGTTVPIDLLQPGDLVAFTRSGESRAHHIVIYIGDGKVIQAPQTGDVVKISPLTSWEGQRWDAVRLG